MRLAWAVPAMLGRRGYASGARGSEERAGLLGSGSKRGWDDQEGLKGSVASHRPGARVPGRRPGDGRGG